jgi:hypothetical protein
MYSSKSTLTTQLRSLLADHACNFLLNFSKLLHSYMLDDCVYLYSRLRFWELNFWPVSWSRFARV